MTRRIFFPLIGLFSLGILLPGSARESAFIPVPRAAAAPAACPQATVLDLDGIVVENGGIAFVKGGTIAMPFALQLTLNNTGKERLSDLKLEVEGENAAEFHVGPWKSDSLAPGKKMPLPLELRTWTPGLKQALVRLTSNDCDRPVLEFNLHFWVTEGADIGIVSFGGFEVESPIAFGPTAGGDGHHVFFYVKNQGLVPLQKLRLRVEGPNPADFVISKWKTKSLWQGESVRMDVEFRPTAAGERTATLVFESDDLDEPEFRMELHGTATDAPRLKVIGQEPGLNFGSLAFGKTARRTFVVANTGFSPLDVVTIDAAPHSGMMVVSPATLFSLAPGQSQKVTVALTQTGLLQTGIINIRAHQDATGGSFIPWISELRAGRK